MNQTQKEYLHDAAQTLGLEADDEAVINGNFCLIFDSMRSASKVAMLASKTLTERSGTRACSEVAQQGRKFSVTVLV